MTETVTSTSSAPTTAASAAEAAGTGPGVGLVMERLYTTVGVHPYDEVSWERRDVVMTNWRDGTINFEQRGVEFPDYWSINATNIVTSKYFRGAVGSDTRESSLKHIIDRVVTAYTEAGRANGCCTRCSPSIRRSGSTSEPNRRNRCRPVSSWPSTTPWTRS